MHWPGAEILRRVSQLGNRKQLDKPDTHRLEHFPSLRRLSKLLSFVKMLQATWLTASVHLFLPDTDSLMFEF